MSERIVRLICAEETVEFDAEAVVLRHKPEGVQILPSATHENTLGFISLFFTWGEIRQIKEFNRGAG